MGSPALLRTGIAPMSQEAIEKVRRVETAARKLEQVPIETDHVFHAGVYARTVMIPAGVLITGTLIKIATLLIVSGDATVFIGDGAVRLTGYSVVPAAAGRKQVFYAHTDVYLTMVFPTDAKDVDAAEREFTDEIDLLMSRKGG